MEETYLYNKIADAIRQDILEGRIAPGGRLPPVREMTRQWECTPGTVQRAYQELARQGLVSSRPGSGTRVSAAHEGLRALRPMRKAALVNRAETFLLEVLQSGYTVEEVERAFSLAADRWRAAETQPEAARSGVLRIGGSHDPVLSAVAARVGELVTPCEVELRFNGSLGGLIALAENKIDVAGCHLWDQQTGLYNRPFIQRLLPGRRAAVIHLARRNIGLMVAPGNPFEVRSLADLARPGLRFVNRQAGSGTRVWLDAQLVSLGVNAAAITDYATECSTHSAVARQVAEGHAGCGLGLEASAREYGLDFIFLTEETYELVCLETGMDHPALAGMLAWLREPACAAFINRFAGYDGHLCGRIEWV